MKNVIVFGATGRVGHQVVKHALLAGMHVTAFARTHDYFAEEAHPRFRFVQGDVQDMAAVDEAMRGQQIVFSALGAKSAAQEITVMSDGAKNYLAAMLHHGVTRVLAIGGTGVLQHDAHTLQMQQPDFSSFLINYSNDHARVWRELQASGLDWTFVCPTQILVNDHSGHYITRADFMPEGKPHIHAGDVADFMVKESVRNLFLKMRVGITGL